MLWMVELTRAVGQHVIMHIIQQPHANASTQLAKFIPRLNENLSLPGTNHDQLFYWEGYDPAWGLPNCLREKMLQLGLGEVALVFDACLTHGLDRGDQFTQDKLTELLKDTGMSPGLIGRALRSGVFPAMSIRRPKPGRPQIRYTVPDISYLVNKYEAGFWLTTDPLELEDLKSLRTYRIALHREFIRRHPGNYSRAFLGRRLGLCKSATINYDREARVERRPRFDRNWLNQYVNGIDLVPSARDWATWLEIQPIDYNRKQPSFRAPPRKQIAAIWMEKGAEVTLVKQLTNEYWVS